MKPEQLIEQLTTEGGAIVTSGVCSEIEIADAQATGRFSALENGMGLVRRTDHWLAINKRREVAFPNIGGRFDQDPVVYASLEEAQNAIPPCERPCSVCAPHGHHWYLDNETMEAEAEREIGTDLDSVPCVCKHGDAKVRVSADADDLPEI